jgi:hypothetical protein
MKGKTKLTANDDEIKRLLASNPFIHGNGCYESTRGRILGESTKIQGRCEDNTASR